MVAGSQITSPYNKAAAVSVVIPVYNRPLKIQAAVSSVLEQTLPPKQLIIVDDGSDPAQRPVLENLLTSYGGPTEVVFLRLSENCGVGFARNLGIKLASQKWIALLDSDDLWFPNKLEKQMRLTQVPSPPTLIHCGEIWFRNGQHLNQKMIHKKDGGDLFSRSLERCLISPSACLFQKDVFWELGGFDINLRVCEDYDLWLRWTASTQVTYLDETLVRKNGGHADQLSRKFHSMDYQRLYALHKISTKHDLKCDQKKALLRVAESKAKILSSGLEKHGDALGRLPTIHSWIAAIREIHYD